MDFVVTLGKGPLRQPIGAQEINGFRTVILGKGPLGQPMGPQERMGESLLALRPRAFRLKFLGSFR